MKAFREIERFFVFESFWREVYTERSRSKPKWDHLIRKPFSFLEGFFSYIVFEIMKYLNKNKIVSSFFDCFGMEGNFAVVQQQRRILSEIDDLINKGLSKYESIMELCSLHTISYEVIDTTESILKVKTFMDGREWTNISLKDEKESLSERLGIEIADMMHIKYTNLIVIENAIKK